MQHAEGFCELPRLPSVGACRPKARFPKRALVLPAEVCEPCPVDETVCGRLNGQWKERE